MIPQIKEINFPSYATLHEATISLSEMGDRTITTQVRIDGSVVPEFDGWELEFKGERFVLPVKEPQAAKDNTTKNSLVDLTFVSWPVNELKRYFFVEMTSISSGTAIADKYIASLQLGVEDFIEAFNRVLNYYFAGRITIELYRSGSGIYSSERSLVDINYTYIWDVLQKINEIYGVRWYIDHDSSTGSYTIRVGYPSASITDHDFEYGYEGGLLRFERQVQDDTIVNVLLGRGGEKNLPYRYFKKVDAENPDWAPDPDAIPELANIYFDRLHDINFRWYIRGWVKNPNRSTAQDAGYTLPDYDDSDVPSEYLWAYRKGRYSDTGFNPVEYVKDDESIAKYGEIWGALDDNDDIYPTIQGVTIDPYGRIDEVVDVSDIVTDDVTAAVEGAANETNLDRAVITLSSMREYEYDIVVSRQFVIPTGKTGVITYSWIDPKGRNYDDEYVDTENSRVIAVRASDGTEFQSGSIPAGTYYYKLHLVVVHSSSSMAVTGTYGIENVKLTIADNNDNAWKPTFDIWVKNIWETEQLSGETDADYSERVWIPIIGDRLGNEAKVIFSDGFMSISEDYEFVIAEYPVVDRTKNIRVRQSDGTYTTVNSEWKITLYKSSAEYDVTGLFIPNATTNGKPVAGDHFFFTGIDMPFIYVKWAEERLNAYKTDHLDGVKDLNPTWVIQLDKVRVHTIEDSDYGQALADRLATGALVRTRDRRFTHGDILSLYVQMITYRWNEPSDNNPYIVPDIEIVLSDKVVSVESPVQQLQNEVNVIQTSYAKTSDIEAVVRKVSAPMFLKKTGESDASSSPTTFSSKVTSKNFRQGGIGGSGWGIYTDNANQIAADAVPADVPNPDSVFEVDKMIIRKELQVNSLVVNQISYIGGKQIVSAAAIECTQVYETDDTYVCSFDQKQGSVGNLFQVGDIAYGQVYEADNTDLRYYKMVVTAVGVNTITLSKTPKDGSGVPKAGDTIVQFGNTSNAARQYVIVRDVIGGGYERMLFGLTSVRSNGTEYYFAGREGSGTERWFVGNRDGQFAEYVNGELNITGRLSVTSQVAKSDGTYVALSTYLNNLQNQISGNIQTWYSEGVPSLSNYPASGWETVSDKNDHIGDLYFDKLTGKAYRFLLDGNNYTWVKITDEDIATALAIGQQNQTSIAGLQYLKDATNQGTLIEGGLVLTSLIQLGSASGSTYNVWAGINGLRDTDELGDGIAAWYGGPMADHEADATLQDYARSLFRFDGSGYLAGGKISWDEDGDGKIPGISWQGNSIVIDGNVKLSSVSGDSVTELISLVQSLSNLWELKTENGVTFIHAKSNYPIVSDNFISAGGLSDTSGGGGSIVAALKDLTDVSNSLNPSAGQVLTYRNGEWNAETPQSGVSSISLTGEVTGSGTSTIVTSIATGAVSTNKLADLAVTAAKLAADSVTTAKIADGNVTLAKLANDAKSMTLWGQTATLGSAVAGDMSSVGKITFTAKSSETSTGNVLEVVTANGLTYLHTNLPIVSDDFISGGGLSDTSGGGTGSSTLAGLTDTTITNPDNGQFLKYNGSSWVNSPIALANIDGFSMATLAAGQVLRYNGQNWTNQMLSLGSLSGVDITNADEDFILKYDANGNWVATENTLGGLSDVEIAGTPTNGQALIYSNGTWVPGAGGAADGPYFCTSSTGHEVTTKVVTPVTTITQVTTGMRLMVNFSNRNSQDNISLQISGMSTAYPCRERPFGSYFTYHWNASTIVEFVFENGYWDLIGNVPALNSALGSVKTINSLAELKTYDLSDSYIVASASTVKEIYDELSSGVSGGVKISNRRTSGTRIVTITIGTTAYDIYAPTSGSGSDASWGSDYSDGTVGLTIGGVTKYVYVQGVNGEFSWDNEDATNHTIDLTVKGDTYTLCLDGYSSGGGGGGSYTLPIASASRLGGIKVGSGLSINSTTGVLSVTGGGGSGTTYSAGDGIDITNDIISLDLYKRSSAVTTESRTSTSGRYYEVEMDSNGKVFVNVPWAGGGSGTSGVTSVAGLTGDITASQLLSALSLSDTISRDDLTNALSSYVTTTDLNTALNGYLPLTAGTSKPLTGTLVGRDIRPSSTETYDLGTSSYFWNNIYVKRIYLANGVYIDYDTDGYIYINGNLVASGYISAGGVSTT